MSDAFFASYLIGLREGLEATLVVSILVAFLVKSGRRQRLPYVLVGVLVAVALSVGFGALLTYTSTEVMRNGKDQELFDGIVSLVAVCFVTWMIFWMRRAARSMGGDLRAGLDKAIELGPAAVVTFALLAVAREGLETAILFFAAVQGATGDTAPLTGIIAGIVTAIALGYGLYASAVRINLSVFFRWTGVLLVVIAAGIFKYAVHDLQEGGLLPGLTTLAYNVESSIAPTTWYAELIRGMFNITPKASVLESIAWVAYLVPALYLFLRPQRPATPAVPAAPTAAPSAVPSA